MSHNPGPSSAGTADHARARRRWLLRCLRLAAAELLNDRAITGEQLATSADGAWEQLVRAAVDYGGSSHPLLRPEEFEPFKAVLLDSVTQPVALLRRARAVV